LDTAKIVESVWLAIPFRYAYKFSRYFDNFILKFPYLAFLRLFAGNPVNSSTLMFRKLSYTKSVTWEDGELRTDCDGFLILNSFLQKFKCVAIREMGSFYRIHPNQMSYNPKYLGEMRGNRLKSMQKVIDGDYPFWLKIGVKMIRRKMYGF
jgi:hypothetical protein